MNKYFVKIPYSYVQYGYLSGYVYAEDEDEAYDLAGDRDNWSSMQERGYGIYWNRERGGIFSDC